MDKIKAQTTIEELVSALPTSVTYLMEKGIKCIACGEPIWGTLEEAAKEKGFGEKDVKAFVSDLNRMADDADSRRPVADQ
jgi:methionine synthase II (cobalamin-independent)